MCSEVQRFRDRRSAVRRQRSEVPFFALRASQGRQGSAPPLAASVQSDQKRNYAILAQFHIRVQGFKVQGSTFMVEKTRTAHIKESVSSFGFKSVPFNGV
jgi:hypothetical protein